MDVDSLVMQVEERLEAFGQGVCGSEAIGCEYVSVILVPGWEGMVREEEGARGRGCGEEFAGQVAGGDRGGNGAVRKMTATDRGGHLRLYLMDHIVSRWIYTGVD